MFELANLGTSLIETLTTTVVLNDIHREYDLSSDARSRKIKIDGSIDLKRATFEINLNYRSEPKFAVGVAAK